MSTTVRLAFRNILRSKRRTVLTMIAVVFGVALSIIGRGFLAGGDEAIIVGVIDGTVGHVSALPADYPTRARQHPVDDLLELNDATTRLLASEAAAWTTRTYFQPLAAHGGDALRVTAIGFDDERDATVFPRTHWRVEGALPRPGSREVGVSPSLAQLLDVKPGDTLILQTRTHEGALNALEVTAAGLVRTGNLALDMRSIWVPRALTTELIASDKPSHLSLRLEDRDDAEAFAARLEAALGSGADTQTWRSESKDLLELQAVRRKSLDLVVFILLALSAFGIANTILMAAYERVREVGTLRAMGMTSSGVVKLFLLEGGFIGVSGGLIGALMGWALIRYWSTHPIDFSKMAEAQGTSVSMAPVIYTSTDPAVIAVSFALGVVVAVLASLYPARVASRMVPADAVRAD